MRYLITIAYDGSKFYGFQRQAGKETIQGEIESALAKINKTPIKIKGAGRTDRGVHAFGQKAHFDLVTSIEPKKLMLAMNRNLSQYIRILDCQVVKDNFHARFSVKKKKYEYRIYCHNDNPLLIDYYYCYKANFNIKKMKLAAKKLKGIHDFKNFISGTRENNEAIIYKINIKQTKNVIIITIVGKSFFRYMVRNIAGALIAIGLERKSAREIEELLEGNQKSSNTAPANGLYLIDIKY